jgi:hypothetical protein
MSSHSKKGIHLADTELDVHPWPPDNDIAALITILMREEYLSNVQILKEMAERIKAINKEKKLLGELMFQASMTLVQEHRDKLNDDELKTLITYIMKPC